MYTLTPRSAPSTTGLAPVYRDIAAGTVPPSAQLTGSRLASLIKPVAKRSIFTQQGYHVWCGAVTRHEASGAYYLVYSRWPKAATHNGWVSASEIALAVSDHPLGPWTFHSVILPGAGGTAWDRDVTHNPTLLVHDGMYYLYYMGNFGNGEYWNHRNNQRVGVAVASHPEGPWKRFDVPALDTRPGSFDGLLTSNPSVTRGPDGRFCMIYKSVAAGLPMPKGGAVTASVAFAQHPLGPWERLDRPVISNPGHPWAVEDPFVWSQDGCYYCIVKDFQGYFSGGEQNVLVLLWSPDGIDWRPTADPFFLRPEMRMTDGTVIKLDALERPQIYFEDGRPVIFCAAGASDTERNLSFNVQMEFARPGE